LNLHKAEYFDGLAKEWDAQNPHDPRKLEYIAGLLELRAGQAVLDVGSGTGVMIPYLLQSVGISGSVEAVDFSQKMVDAARLKYPRDKYPNVTFHPQDVNDMHMRGEYDVVLCYSCFPHFEDQQATIRHLAAGLKARGRMVIAHSESRKAINRLHMESSGDISHDFLPPMRQIRQMMQTVGLKVTKEIDISSIFLIIAEKPPPRTQR
jgi:demethylmenaquinone methyltransferase/2-methoxy-6-polyprenyl-1,4-benzoquinol methylase